jgi:hypothetical protein
MANPAKILMDIPKDAGVHVKSAGDKGEKYVYKYTRYYRNQDGKPLNQSKMIGKVDIESGKMIPNDNYYAMYDVMPDISDLGVWGYGYVYLVQKCCKDMGLLGCLETIFGGQADEIVAVAAFMISEGNAVDGIDDWQEKNLIQGLRKKLTFQSCVKLFESISPQKRHSFFKQWVSAALKDETVCYEVTSVSSHSKTITNVERGYNRDDEDSPRLDIAMFRRENGKLPLCYKRYNGSPTDETNLSYVTADAESVGIKKVKLMLDDGVMSQELFVGLNGSRTAFTTRVSANLDVSKEMIKSNINGIDGCANKLGEKEIFCAEQPTSIHGVSGRLMLYFDPQSHAQLCGELSDRIARLEAELSSLKRCPISELSRFAKCFAIAKRDDGGGFDFVVDADAVDRLKRNKGFFLLFTTDATAKPQDLLHYYRAEDSDEKLFEQIELDMRGSRARSHDERAFEGKIFVAFIALAVRAYMLGKLENYLDANSTSLKKSLAKLANIIVVRSNGKCRLAKALTKQQKEILASFDAVVDVAASLDNCMR